MSSDRIILLTPYSGQKNILIKTIISTIDQLDSNDLWIIILDNQNIKEFLDIKKKYKQLIFLDYNGPKGAGNSRNIGLDYIKENIDGEFLLFPFDGDDTLVAHGINLIKKTMKKNQYNLISFAHCKIWPNGTKRIIKHSGIFTLNDLLKKYITPCGSTVLKIKDVKILHILRFGSRFRANDALFFYQAARQMGKFKCYPNILLNYNIGNTKSLSGRKFIMVYYKFMTFKDFGLSNLKAIYYTIYYIFNGIRRYYFKHSI